MKRLAIASMILCAGCAEMQLFVRDELKLPANGNIVIGGFISRDTNYDPFLADRLIESLCFVFFREGYNVRIAGRKTFKGLIDQSDAAALCADAQGDVLIHGAITRKESGPLAHRSVYYEVSFVIRDKSGVIKGEGRYCDSDAAEQVFIRNAAESFVAGFKKQVRSR